ncbi:MAG TPA: wax ester/triacylglycerol synthase domain-containing protein [Acidimicrobiales bacterium]|jgi:WS/DGAT/MGAT family acyltransferase|nr:wax ester/triacylglycerol synthase domain-containing protein [Acidimicrobiales bacterium]
MAENSGSEQRMGDTDALMWGIEKDPLLRSTIVSVLLFEGPIDHGRLADKVERATFAIPRLRQRVVTNGFSIGPPRWETDAHFDLRYHLRFVGASGARTLAEVLDIARPEAMSSFDSARPLWQMLVVDDMAGGKSAVVVKLHHTITDGIGGVKLGMHLFDLEPSPPPAAEPLPEAPPARVFRQWERVFDAWNHEQRRNLELAARLVPAGAASLAQLASAPGATVRRAGEMAASLGRLLAPANRPLSPVMTGRSLGVDLDTLSLSLPDTKAAAKAVGVRLNDVFIAGVVGGLRRYHDAHGSAPEGLRMGMPISLRPPAPRGNASPGGDPPPDRSSAGAPEAGTGGNQFVPLRFVVPLQIEDPIARMHEISRLVAQQRAEPALGLVDALSLVTRKLPQAAQIGVLGGMLRTVDFVTSNVPGVPVPLYLGGAKMEAQYPFGPRSGAAVNVTLLSYLDRLFIGVNSDPAAVADQPRLMACLRDGFDEVLKIA